MQVVQGGTVSETWVQVPTLPLSDHVTSAGSPSLWKRPVWRWNAHHVTANRKPKKGRCPSPGASGVSVLCLSMVI